jgi:uncharacterized protein (DUF433 family)
MCHNRTMTLVLDPLPVPLVDNEGELRIEGTRIPLHYLVYEYRQGASAEEIATRYPSLTLAQVHTLLAYYLANRKTVDTYVQEQEIKAEALRKEIETRFPTEGLRERLLARLEHKL